MLQIVAAEAGDSQHVRLFEEYAVSLGLTWIFSILMQNLSTCLGTMHRLPAVSCWRCGMARRPGVLPCGRLARASAR
jgi:hypothetical protein